MEPFYEAVVISEGGRNNGHVFCEDGSFDLPLNMPKEMGGMGGKPNPEILFAACYAACFETAMQYSAGKVNRPLTKSKVIAHVAIGKSDKGAFDIETKLEIFIPGYGKENAHNLVNEAHRICPYSRMSRGNMKVDLVLVEF